MKPGRNDPCPCGSGKKHKQCCLAQPPATASSHEELLWRRIRRATADFPARMFRFFVETYGDFAVDEAWGAYTLWDDGLGDFDPESRHIPVFMPWAFHRWAPESEETDVADASLHGVPPTQTFLARKGRQLDPLHRAYLEACLRSPFTFLEVVACEPGRGFDARDVVSGDTLHVWEGSASRMLNIGDLLYAQPVEVQGVVLLEACSSVIIPPTHKVNLLRLRNEGLANYSDPSDPVPWDDILRDHYLKVVDEVLNPRLPVTRNTDGHQLAPQTLVFDIDDADQAFERLSHLNFNQTPAELLGSAERDDTGRIRHIAFDWLRAGNAVHASWDNTVLGHVSIDATRLSLQVNSDERATLGRRHVEEALGNQVRYRVTERQSIEAELRARGLRGDGDGPSDPMASAMNDPAMQAAVAELTARHYESWPDVPLPALDGLTPLEAARTEQGRELVDALLQQMQRAGHNSHVAMAPETARRLRERLGLSR